MNEKTDVQENVITIDRFERDLFALSPDRADEGIRELKDKYGTFFFLFTYRIASLGSPDSVMMKENIISFITDTNIRTLYNDSEKLYSDFSKESAAFNAAFTKYAEAFPGKIIPRMITMVSGFSYPITCDSTTLGISLDMYLGPGYHYYSTIEPPLPVFMRNRMHRDYIVSDAMKGWITSDFEIDESTAQMIDMMVYQGKVAWFLKNVLPDAHDTLLTGYTLPQWEWCVSAEKKIWSFFIENKLLFSNDPNLMNKYVNDGPTTNGFPKESPGNIGKFIGMQIVSSYMKNNPDVSLKQLMEERDLVKIFNESGYKPPR